MLIRKSGIDADPEIKLFANRIIKKNGDMALSVNDVIKAMSYYTRLAKEELNSQEGNQASLKNFLENMDKAAKALEAINHAGNAVYASKGFIEMGLRYSEYKDMLANKERNGSVHVTCKTSRETEALLLKSRICMYKSLEIMEKLPRDPKGQNYGFLLAEISDFAVFSRDSDMLKICTRLSERKNPQ